MTIPLLETHTGTRSWLDRRDPRAKVAAFMIALVLTVSAKDSFVALYLLIGLLLLTSGVAGGFVARRGMAALPFILMAGVVLAVSGNPLAWAVVLRAFAAAALVTILTGTTRFGDLLWGLRGLGAPRILNLIAILMQRYIALLLEEWRSMTRAAACRAPRCTLAQRIRLFGGHIATLFVRSWDRSERVHAAMLARGFHGELPVMKTPRWQTADSVLVAGMTLAFGAARWLG